MRNRGMQTYYQAKNKIQWKTGLITNLLTNMKNDNQILYYYKR